MTNHIIISSTVPRIRYISNGVLATYSFPFAIFKDSDLKVYFNSELQEDTTYSILGAGESDGGTVTLSNVPESGIIITLTRELPIERTTDFQEGGALRANTLNDELDYQIACQQQIADNLNRSMVLPPYAADSDINLTLPTPCAGKAIVWNQDGTNLENSTVEVNALESTLRGYKESAESAASTATAKADNASCSADTALTQAGIATTQAGIATQKAEEVATALSTKANTNLNNITDQGVSAFATRMCPSYESAIQKTWNTEYIAEKNGYLTFCAWCNGNGKGVYATINNTIIFKNADNTPMGPGYQAHQHYVGGSFPIAKGDTYTLSGGSDLQKLLFHPMKGEM